MAMNPNDLDTVVRVAEAIGWVDVGVQQLPLAVDPHAPSAMRASGGGGLVLGKHPRGRGTVTPVPDYIGSMDAVVMDVVPAMAEMGLRLVMRYGHDGVYGASFVAEDDATMLSIPYQSSDNPARAACAAAMAYIRRMNAVMDDPME